MKKRLTLLLTDEQIRAIKVQAAVAGLPVNQWIIDQLSLAETAQAGPDPVHIADDTPQEAQEAAQDDTTAHMDPGPQADDDTAIDAQDDPSPAQVDADGPDPGMVDQEGDTDVADPVMSEKDARAWQLVEIERKYPGPGNAQKRIDVLNDSGVLLNDVPGQWTKRNASNAIRNARNYLGVEKP